MKSGENILAGHGGPDDNTNGAGDIYRGQQLNMSSAREEDFDSAAVIGENQVEYKVSMEGGDNSRRLKIKAQIAAQGKNGDAASSSMKGSSSQYMSKPPKHYSTNSNASKSMVKQGLGGD